MYERGREVRSDEKVIHKLCHKMCTEKGARRVGNIKGIALLWPLSKEILSLPPTVGNVVIKGRLFSIPVLMYLNRLKGLFFSCKLSLCDYTY